MFTTQAHQLLFPSAKSRNEWCETQCVFYWEYSNGNKAGKSSKNMAGRGREKPDLRAIGSRIRGLRGEMLQEELAAYLGISQGQLSKIERGNVGPTVEVLTALAQKFGKTIDWIVRGE